MSDTSFKVACSYWTPGSPQFTLPESIPFFANRVHAYYLWEPVIYECQGNYQRCIAAAHSIPLRKLASMSRHVEEKLYGQHPTYVTIGPRGEVVLAPYLFPVRPLTQHLGSLGIARKYLTDEFPHMLIVMRNRAMIL